MYSRDEKRRIVEDLLASGLTVAAASRKPGWPGRDALAKWVREAQRGELPVSVPVPKGHVGNRLRHAHYSDKTKAEAIRLYEADRRPVDIARLLGIDCSGVIRVWWKKANTGRLEGEPFKPKPLPGGVKGEPMPRRDLPPDVAALNESELENACLRAVLADLKAGGWDLGSISNKRKVELGERLRLETGRALREITAFLRISKSSYEYHRAKALRNEDKHAKTRVRIKELFEENRGVYGYRRIWGDLKGEGIKVSEKVVRRIMAQGGLVVFSKSRRYNSYKGDISPEVPNLVGRDFSADAPNVLWLTDISEFKIPAGKVYLSPVLDCFDGFLPSWKISTSPDAALVNTMLDDAIGTLHEGERPIVHNDQGSHYRWPGWIARMDAAGLVRSMSRKGCSPDNAACEGLFGRIKTEMFYYRSWKGVSIEEFIAILDGYLHWYNEKRIKKSLGYKSPVQYRRSLGLAA